MDTGLLLRISAATSLVLCVAVNAAYAQINRCTGADGKVEYQTQPCPANTSTREIAPPAAANRPSPATPAQSTWKALPDTSKPLVLPSSDPPIKSIQYRHRNTAGFEPAPIGLKLEKLPVSANKPPKELANGAEVIMAAGKKSATSTTKVIVRRAGKKVLLILSSEEKVSWQVAPGPTTEIVGIVLSSTRGKSEVYGPKGIPTYAANLSYLETDDPRSKFPMGELYALFGINMLDAAWGSSPLPAVIEIYKNDVQVR